MSIPILFDSSMGLSDGFIFFGGGWTRRSSERLREVASDVLGIESLCGMSFGDLLAIGITALSESSLDSPLFPSFVSVDVGYAHCRTTSNDVVFFHISTNSAALLVF